MSRLTKLQNDLSGLKLNCEYWDVRIEDSFETSIGMTDSEVVTCTASPSLGAFMRVRKDGFWVFEATTNLSRLAEVLEKLTKEPVLGKSSSPFKPQKREPHIAVKSVAKKFSAVSLEEKLNLTKSYADIFWKHPKMASTSIRYQDVYKVKTFLNSLGTSYEYDFNQAGFLCWYTLKENQQIFEDGFRFYASDFSEMKGREREILKALSESEKFLKAPSIPPGKYRVLLDPEVAGVFTHESFGHKSEADFMLGNEHALEEWKLGKKIAAECLTIVDYGGHLNSSGYCPVDDDGVPAQKNYLIKNGILTGRLHSTETAGELKETPTGNSRAISFEFEPIVRMTSTYIEPGHESVDAIISKCEGALLVEGVKHGSGLSTFTIAPNRGYLIGKNGAKEPVRLAVISGSVFETLKNIEAVSSEFHLHSSAIGGCGKMDQWPLPVADGGPYVLIREMQVS